VLRRSLALLAPVVGALVLSSAALAASVTVRVEGKTRTIFGSTPVKVQAGNPLEALEAASVLGEFHYVVTSSSFGDYVSQIGRYLASGSSGWVFKVNGASPPVGADAATLHDGDTVLWYWATFGPAGGPPTLSLKAAGGSCYLVTKFDDAGHERPAAGADLHVDGRRVRANAGGRGCLGRHVGLVRAYAVGAVRSNTVK
jgi:Domain of unknown function (DUF4430)